MLRIAMYQPDIPQNTGAMIRLCACLGLGLDIIEPCGFPWNERKIKQSAMDYYEHADIVKHASWNIFLQNYKERRIILMTTKSSIPYTEFKFKDDDILLAGRESAGVPDEVHESADGRIMIPMSGELRSINVVNASAMIIGEGLRQLQKL